MAQELGVDPSTVTRRARLLGIPDVRRRRSAFDWTAIQAFYDAGHTIRECRERFGFSLGAWDKATARGDIVTRTRSRGELSHRTRDLVEQLLARGFSQAAIARRLWRAAVRAGRIVPRAHVVPIDELLVAGCPRSRGHEKARLLNEGLKAGHCERCGLSEWLGKPLGLELHHVNGDGDDNRLGNLMLLCGNCHSQTDNWGGRGVPRAARRPQAASGP